MIKACLFLINITIITHKALMYTNLDVIETESARII